jgi:hypothetical protein
MEGRQGMTATEDEADEDERGEDTAARMAPRSSSGKPPAGDTARNAAETAHRAYGPRAIGGLIARVTRPGFRRRSPAASQIMTDWLDIMGPDLGARTVPQKLSAGTLTIACTGPAAMELQHFAPQLIARINGHIGGRPGESALVQRLRFVQQIAPVKAAPIPAPRRVAPKAPPPIDLEPGPVRDALARLALALQTHRDRASAPPILPSNTPVE